MTSSSGNQNTQVPILFTHGYFLSEDIREQQIMKPYVPLGILCISAYLEAHGIQNAVFDSTFASFAEFEKCIEDTQPHLLGIYTNLMTKLNVLKMMRYVKTNFPHIRIVLGGPEVTHHAWKFLQHGADAVVIGEGEQTMLELCMHDVWDENIAGIAYLDQAGTMVKTLPRMKVKVLDELPFPNRKKVVLEKYLNAWKQRHGESAVSLSTMRGCPYTCKWCSRAVYGESYRRRSAAKVVDEIEMLQSQYAFDTIWFVDDVFTISHKWLTAFHDELLRRKVRIRYECITRADRLNEQVIQLLKNSGCFRVWIGAESGSQKVIDAMDRRVDVKQVRDMIQLARQKGLEAGTFIMLGYPGEEDADVRETLHHLKQSNPDHFTITVAYPIKGTPFYAEVEPQWINHPEWEHSTDRQIEFERRYNRRYYEFAVRWISNEMAVHHSTGKGVLAKVLYKMKASASRLMMNYQMLVS